MDTSTIQAAIDAAANVSPAGTVTLGAGTFLIDSQLMVTGGVTLVGQGWENTIIKQTATPGANTRVMTLDDNSTVLHVTLTGGRTSATWANGSGAGAYVKNGTISWCRVTDNATGVGIATANNLYGCGVSFYEGRGKIDHSIIDSNVGGSVSGYCHGGGIGINNPSGVITVEASLIFGNSATGDGGGIYASFGNNHNLLTVRNTTVAGNVASGSGGGVFATEYYAANKFSFALVNSILVDNTSGSEGADQNLNLPSDERIVSGYAAQSSNNRFANETAALGTDSQSVAGSGSAWFVDAANGDYHLSANSPAIGAGTTYTGIGVDLDNVTFANSPAVGCYEYANRVADPVFNPESGVAFYPTTNVTLTCATENATIYYTTDGSTPTDSSTAYSGAIALSATTTIKARAYATGKGPSAIVSATYTYQRPTPQPTEFAKSIEITLTTALASTEITTGVPALVRLKEGSNGGIVGFDYDDFTLAKGGDMMFVDASGNPLPHEVDTWDTTGESLVWVKLPSTAASTKITMYYGKGTTSTASSTDVWSDYVGVWHLSEVGEANTDVTVQDSTEHGYTGTAIGIATSGSAPGKIGSGWRISDSSTADDTAGGILMNSMTSVTLGSEFTVSAWMWHKNQDYHYDHVFYRRDVSNDNSAGWWSEINGGSHNTINVDGGAKGGKQFLINTTKGVWKHLSLVYSGTTGYTVADGGAAVSHTLTAAASDNGKAIAFGTDSDNNDVSWKGIFDELRIRKGPYDYNYLAAEYTAMNTAETDIFEYGEAQSTEVTPQPPSGVIVPGETPAATRQTIQDAIDAAANLAVPGTVTLGDGLFEIDAQLMVTGGVTLVGQGWTNTVVKQSTAATRCMIIDDEAKVEGVTITGGQETAANGAGAGAWVKSGTISWCCISNNTSTANYVSGCGVSFSGGLGVIDHSIVTDNIALSGQTVYGCGIGGLDTAGPVTIDTCLITHNLIKGGGSGGGIGIKNLGGDCIVRNCTVVGNTANTHTAGIRLENRASGNSTAKGLLINTIAVGNMHSSDGSEMNIADNFVFDKTNSRNCLFGLESETGMASSSLFGAPGFVNAESGDYRLYQDSQAAAGGVAYTGIGSDIDNVAFAATPSIGCYQYTALTANPTFSIESGTLLDSAASVALSCATEGAKIYYTTDGSLPTESSTEYTTPLLISATTTINARAYADGLGRSGVASAYYPYVLQPGETPAATRQTIQDAIDMAANLAVPGTVTLGDGLFEIDSQLMVTGGVTLVGQSMDDTIIKQTATTHNGNTRVMSVKEGATVRNVTLTGGSVSGNWAMGGGADVDNGTLSWCCITNNAADTGNNKYGGGVFIARGQIDHCIIADNAVRTTAADVAVGGGVAIRNPTGSVIIDSCLIAGNRASSTSGHIGKGGGIGVEYNANNINVVTVRNVTIVGNTVGDGETANSSIGGAVYVAYPSGSEKPSTFVMMDCVISGNTTLNANTTVNIVSGADVDYCLFDIADDKVGVNSLVGDPVFVNPTDGDYRLGSGSAAVGVGTTYEGIGVDLDNVAFAEPPSMGCYEYGDLTATPTFTPASGEIFYYTLDVEIACTNSGAVIYYTTDGTVPTTSSSLYEGPIEISATTTVKARAYTAGKGLSAVASATYTHSIPEELSFYTPHVEPNSLGADIRVTLAHVGQGATVADVYIAWGTDYDHLCTPVLVAENVVAKQRVAYSIDNLENTTHYVFRLSAENDQHRSCTRDGEFTTLSHEYLALSSPTVTEVAETSAKLGVGVVTLGEHVNSARVVLKWGTDPNALSQSKVLDPAALEGAALVETLNGLTANTLYYFSFEATSDAETPEVVSVSGSFMTGGPALESAARSKGYPSSVAEGKAVTYDADAAGDPVTLEPGQPYCVVDAAGYTYVYHSTVGSGADYVFRNEADFRYNASARIGNTYYLFLSDAVDASAEGDTIELLRNNYAVGELMTISTRLTIRGNGYVVKVDEPFTDDSGYVDLNCTTDVKTIFQIDNGGDVLLEDMTIMGGGQNVGSGTGAGTHDVHTYAVVVAHEMSGNNTIYQTASTGVLEMRHVTITRSQGGLFTAFGTKVYAENCNLVRNARYCGGGLYNRGFLVMVGSSLSENRSLSSAGGGAAAENQGDMYMNNCVICNNGSTEVGGAINQFNSGNIQTGNGRITRLYLMNSTLTGNFSSYTSDGGGGIGSHANTTCTNLDIYAVNVLLCNNYYYNTANQTLTDSDFFVKDGTTMADNNLLYSVYGRINASSSVSPHVTECWQLSDPSAQSVFKGYTQNARVYEQSKTTAPITGAALESDADQPLARYAPIFDGSLADVGTDGVYTYFDASDWRHEVVKMSYKTIEGTMTALGKCAAASEADIVTTFYESSFAYGVDDREIGIVGASGFGADVRSYTLYLVRNPQNGTVSKNLTLNGMSYPEGSEVTVVATPEFACTFLGWYDENDQLVSDKAAYVFTMDSDKHLYAQFSGPSSTVTLDVDCEQAEKGTHTKFPIKVTTDWLGKAFPTICPNGAVTTETKSAVEAALNAPDSANGLNHVWQDYVLGGMLPGDEHGRIWIRADQTADKATLRFRMQELAKTQGCGFDVKYRLLAMTPGVDADYNREGAYASSGTFVENITSDQRVHRVIDMIFVPDGYQTSCEYVTTVNTAGVLRVASEKAVEIVSTPWAGFSPSSNPAVAATDYVKASCLSVGDVLYVYDKENSNYLAWSVQENGTWAALDTYLIVNGAVSYVGGADATRTNSLPRGAGAWLERKDPTKPIYLYGQYDPTLAKTTLEQGFNLVGSPWSAPFDVSTLTPAASGDRIVIPTGGAPINCTYDATKHEWGWYKSVEAVLKDKNNNPILHPVTHEPLVGVTSVWTTEGLELPVGLGFWYYSAGSGSSELAWPTAQQ
jgi:hypothetical protein